MTDWNKVRMHTFHFTRLWPRLPYRLLFRPDCSSALEQLVLIQTCSFPFLETIFFAGGQSPCQLGRLAEFVTILGDLKLVTSMWEALTKEGKPAKLLIESFSYLTGRRCFFYSLLRRPRSPSTSRIRSYRRHASRSRCLCSATMSWW